MNYTCTIHTDYCDPSKTEEILKNCTRIITEALRNQAAGVSGVDSKKGANRDGENHHS